MAKDIRKVQVCFNLLDPEQRMIYDKVQSYPNKSSYVKRVLLKELTQVGMSQVAAAAVQPVMQVDIEVSDFI